MISDIIVFFISSIIFGLILLLDISPRDLQMHGRFVQQWLSESKPLPPNVLYYLVVSIFSFLKDNLNIIYLSSIFTLSLSVTLKFIVTKKIISDFFRLNKVGNNRHQKKYIILLSFLMLFVFSFPNIRAIIRLFYSKCEGSYYLGQISPNVWHNSTLIFLMPFALLLFWQSYQQLIDPQSNRIWIISLLIVVNIFIKPSFFFVFIIIYPMLLIDKFGFRKIFWLNLLPIIVGVLILYIEYHFIYVSPFDTTAKAGIKIAYFHVWSHFLSSSSPIFILLSIVTSFCFPITYLIVYRKEFFKNILTKYAFFLSVTGLIIFSTLTETGTREFHGNFGWQNIICSYILFMVTGQLLLKKIISNDTLLIEKKNKILILLYLLHFLSGIMYIGKAFLSRSLY